MTKELDIRKVSDTGAVLQHKVSCRGHPAPLTTADLVEVVVQATNEDTPRGSIPAENIHDNWFTFPYLQSIFGAIKNAAGITDEQDELTFNLIVRAVWNTPALAVWTKEFPKQIRFVDKLKKP